MQASRPATPKAEAHARSEPKSAPRAMHGPLDWRDVLHWLHDDDFIDDAGLR